MQELSAYYYCNAASFFYCKAGKELRAIVKKKELFLLWQLCLLYPLKREGSDRHLLRRKCVGGRKRRREGPLFISKAEMEELITGRERRRGGGGGEASRKREGGRGTSTERDHSRPARTTD